MKNKVLIKLIVPTLMEEFEMYIPVNERILKIKELVLNTIYDLSDNELKIDMPYSLINPETGKTYENSLIVRDTDIRNNTRLVLYHKI